MYGHVSGRAMFGGRSGGTYGGPARLRWLIVAEALEPGMRNAMPATQKPTILLPHCYVGISFLRHLHYDMWCIECGPCL